MGSSLDSDSNDSNDSDDSDDNEQCQKESIVLPPATSSRSSTSSYTIHDSSTTHCLDSQQQQQPQPHTTTHSTFQPPRAHYRATLRVLGRSLWSLDHFGLSYGPGIRTAMILMLEWSFLGVGTATSSPFQLGVLLVGLTDPSGTVGRRFWTMGWTSLVVVVLGTCVPGVLYDTHVALQLSAAAAMGVVTGYGSIFEGNNYALALKLAATMYAVQGGVNRSTHGYESIGGWPAAALYAFYGALASWGTAVVLACVHHEALRTWLFSLWHGLGWHLQQQKQQRRRRWRPRRRKCHKNPSQQFTSQESTVAIPTLTLAVERLRTLVVDRQELDEPTQKWCGTLVQRAECLRASSLCLTYLQPPASGSATKSATTNSITTTGRRAARLDEFWGALGTLFRYVALVLHFPWITWYLVPGFRTRYQKARQAVDEAAQALKEACRSSEVEENVVQQPDVVSTSSSTSFHNTTSATVTCSELTPIIDLMVSNAQAVADTVADRTAWPSWESPWTLVPRIRAAFALDSRDQWRSLLQRVDGGTHNFALRFAFAFTAAMIPEIILGEGYRAHWFPMTVALIMTPSGAATYERVAQRTMGTVLGLFLGTALYPLFDYTVPLIIVLGLTSCCVILFATANYAVFTFFITGWVVTTNVGGGTTDLWETLFWRFVWTISAGLLVLFVTQVAPTQSTNAVEDKLAAWARAIQHFTRVALEEHDRCCCCDNVEAKTDKDKVKKARHDVIQARIDAMTSVNQAALTPKKGYLVDPHYVAPALVCDLIKIVVVPQTLLLVPTENATSLVADIDESTFLELDRLAKRFERRTSTKRSKRIEEEMEETPRGPFSRGISRAHQRLDKAGIPP